jgi:1-deoxy-D-xylulose-5-phosphate reductoisomerase
MTKNITISPPRSVTILGATGSIGDSTLRVIDQHRDRYIIEALTAQNNFEKLIELALCYRPSTVAIGNKAHYTAVNEALKPEGITVLAGAEGVIEAAAIGCDISIAAIVGAAGLRSTLTAIAQGNQVAIANKEALVCAGELVMRACNIHRTTLLPIDSEHNAIFQVLTAGVIPEKITLTASGGPLLNRPLDTMHSVTPKEAVNHPRWSMGAKISVDSATMMNKGLELIEAHYLFGLPESQIDVLIHPESIIHSLVHHTDGSVLAQLGMPDMAIPIAYALSWPHRLKVATPRLDLAALKTLNFSHPDAKRFPALQLARATLNAGTAHLIALNAANEIAVAAFLDGRIKFTDIVRIVEKVVEKTASSTILDIDAVLDADAQARNIATVMAK